MSDFWIQTMSGRKVCLDNIDPSTIDEMDIAHSLSMQSRFNGHCLRQYNIAQHSLLVYELVKKAIDYPKRFPPLTGADIAHEITELQIMLGALLHDSSEAYTGDIVNPLKRFIRSKTTAFDDLEEDITKVIFTKYDCVTTYSLGLIHPLIKDCDREALAIEKKYLMIPIADIWGKLPNVDSHPPIDCLSPESAKHEFIKVFSHLRSQIKLMRTIDAR